MYNGERVYPEAGQRFLELLPVEFRGSIFRAELVEE